MTRRVTCKKLQLLVCFMSTVSHTNPCGKVIHELNTKLLDKFVWWHKSHSCYKSWSLDNFFAPQHTLSVIRQVNYYPCSELQTQSDVADLADIDRHSKTLAYINRRSYIGGPWQILTNIDRNGRWTFVDIGNRTTCIVPWCQD